MLHCLLPGGGEWGSLVAHLEFYGPRTTTEVPSRRPSLPSCWRGPASSTKSVDLFRIACRLDLDELTGTTAGGLHLATFGGIWQVEGREDIALVIAKDESLAEVARRLGRPTSTVAREVARSGGACRARGAPGAAGGGRRAGAPPEGPKAGGRRGAVVVAAGLVSGLRRSLRCVREPHLSAVRQRSEQSTDRRGGQWSIWTGCWSTGSCRTSSAS